MTELTLILANALLLAGLWWFFTGPWRQLRIDETRQSLFELRDKLFDMAADGELDFDAPAYGRARDQLNGMIRFTHQVSLIRLVVMAVLYRRDRTLIDRYQQSVEAELRALPPAVANEVRAIVSTAHLILLHHALVTSLLGIILWYPLSGMLEVVGLMNRVKQMAQSLPQLAAIDAEAESIGHCGGGTAAAV